MIDPPNGPRELKQVLDGDRCISQYKRDEDPLTRTDYDSCAVGSANWVEVFEDLFPKETYAQSKTDIEYDTFIKLLLPRVVVGAADYLATITDEEADIIAGIPALIGRNQVTLARVGGEDIHDMDGFTGISKQLVRVTTLSLRQHQNQRMEDTVKNALRNYIGRPRGDDGSEILRCLHDETFDIREEESSIYGSDMFFIVTLSG